MSHIHPLTAGTPPVHGTATSTARHGARAAAAPGIALSPAVPGTLGDVSPDGFAGAGPEAGIVGGKAAGLMTMLRLGLPVPPGFVISTGACRLFLRDGRFPPGLDDETVAAVHDLEAATGRRFGCPERPLAVSVRSGGAVSMPGMMDTVLGLGLGTDGFDDAFGQLRQAVARVFSSWHTPRAITYRELHGIPNDVGTAVIVQSMVFGDHDEHSGSGVAFSRDPSRGPVGRRGGRAG